MKRGWDIPFFNYIKTKQSTWVSYNFKAALNYSSLYRSIHFWCHDATLKKIFSTEKVEFNSEWANKLLSPTKVREILNPTSG